MKTLGALCLVLRPVRQLFLSRAVVRVSKRLIRALRPGPSFHEERISLDYLKPSQCVPSRKRISALCKGKKQKNKGRREKKRTDRHQSCL